MATEIEFEAELVRAFGSGARPNVIRLDLSGLTFIDSCGIRAIIALASSSGCVSLVLESPSPPVRRVLELTGVDNHPRIEIGG